MEDILAIRSGNRPAALVVDNSIPQHTWARQALERPFVDVDYVDPAFAIFTVDSESEDCKLGVHGISGHIEDSSMKFNSYCTYLS